MPIFMFVDFSVLSFMISTGKEDEKNMANQTDSVKVHNNYITINPRRACAARVTVVVLCVCLSASILAL